ncbi:hypothetical protein EVAR_103348_1 [Eumeta japonica]|uniref:Uncharacterized protein n=1 Tax=Eumeta variegata TaxID=151549 RepID=A0A4C1Y801_EUMVA|nr:hypothetical protein EVAR_103348_1 [Eumeta japonica]
MIIVDTLESARKAAEDTQYSSSPETCGRGQRRRKVISPVQEALNRRKIYLITRVMMKLMSIWEQVVPPLPNFNNNSSKSMSNLSRKDRGSSDSGSETRDDGDTEIDADIAKRFLHTCEILDDPKSNRDESKVSISRINGVNENTNAQFNRKLGILEEKLYSCVHLLGKLITEVRDLKQRCTSNNTGNSAMESVISAEVDTHLKLDTRDEAWQSKSGRAAEADDKKNTGADAAHQDGNI